MFWGDNMTEEENQGSLARRAGRYYAGKVTDARREEDKYRGSRTRANWQGSGASLKGWMARFGANLNLPYKSIATFVGCWMLLEIGWPLVIVFGVVSAGSVWSIPAAIPCMYISIYATMLLSGINLIRELVTELGNRRDNLVKALFRGYFWSLLAVGLVLLVHTFFKANMPQLFLLPIIYFIPIEVTVLGTGGTVPIPVPLGLTGFYIDTIVTILVFTVGVIGSCIGGMEILRYVLNSSRQQGSYGAIFSVLMLAVYPALNIYFSSVFLTTFLDLFRRLITWT